MVYRYKDYVDKNKIEVLLDEERNLRYMLKVPLKNNGDKSVMIIMKNPSLADNQQSDFTINNVLNFCSEKKYSMVYILNLYSYYSTDSKMIGNLVRNNQEQIAIGERNDEVIRELSNKVNDIIVGWGSATFGCTTKYKKRIKTVTKIINNNNLFYVQNVGGGNWYPRHPQVWHMKSKLNLITWVPPFL